MKYEYYQDEKGNVYELTTDLEQLIINDLKKSMIRNNDKQDEIERLKNELQDTKEHLGEYLHEQEEENKRLNNIINELEKLELYEFEPDYDYEENLVEHYTPFNIREYIEELKGSDKDATK